MSNSIENNQLNIEEQSNGNVYNLELFIQRIEELTSKYDGQENAPQYIKQLLEIREKIDLFQKQNAIAVSEKKNIFSKIKTFFQKRKFNNFMEIEGISLDDLFKQSAEIYLKNVLEPQNPLKNPQIARNGEIHQLYTRLLEALKYHSGLEKDEDGRYKLYPVKEEQRAKKLHDEELYKIALEHFKTIKTDKELLQERTSQFNSGIELVRKDVLKSEVIPYFGDIDYITERAEFIVECINKIILDQSVDSKYKKTSMSVIQKAESLVEEMKQLAEGIEDVDEKEFKRRYIVIESDYQIIRAMEDIVSEDVHEIWNEFLTNPKDYKPGEHFAFLTHTFTEGAVNPKKLNKVCCTLITDKCMPVPYGNFGIICNPKNRQISTMCTGDAGSWPVKKEDIFGEYLNTDRQFAEHSGVKGQRIYYEEPRVSKLILPSTMEQEMIQDNFRFNGEHLNYKKAQIYSEIYVLRDEEPIEVQSLFTMNGKDNQMIAELQQEEGYPDICINIDLNAARERFGLPPLQTENSINKEQGER